ncbi:restriction endonuclease subunit S [Ligilactobacillus salivarius]
MDNKKNGIPKLRFPGFTGAWEQRKLGEVIISEHKGKVKSIMKGGNTNYLETNYLNGGTAQKVDAIADVSKDDVLILWDGSKAGTIYHGFEGALGSTLKAYVPKYSGDFLYQILKKNQDKIYQSYRTPNIPHVIKNFTEKFNVSIPTIIEQQEIGDFFKQLDSLITLHQRKLEHLQEQKKGLLQKMFPKNGEVVPEVRFPGFTDDWEQRKLGDYLSIPTKEPITDINELKLMTLKLNLEGITLTANRETLKLGATKYYKRHEGQLLYGKQNFFHGSIALIPKEAEGYATSGDVPALDISNVNGKYLVDYISRPSYFKAKEALATGTGSKRIHEKTLLNFKITVPSLEEQNAISDFITNYTNLITLHQRKLEHLELMKKGLLQQMFV